MTLSSSDSLAHPLFPFYIISNLAAVSEKDGFGNHIGLWQISSFPSLPLPPMQERQRSMQYNAECYCLISISTMCICSSEMPFENRLFVVANPGRQIGSWNLFCVITVNTMFGEVMLRCQTMMQATWASCNTGGIIVGHYNELQNLATETTRILTLVIHLGYGVRHNPPQGSLIVYLGLQYMWLRKCASTLQTLSCQLGNLQIFPQHLSEGANNSDAQCQAIQDNDLRRSVAKMQTDVTVTLCSNTSVTDQHHQDLKKLHAITHWINSDTENISKKFNSKIMSSWPGKEHSLFTRDGPRACGDLHTMRIPLYTPLL